MSDSEERAPPQQDGATDGMRAVAAGAAAVSLAATLFPETTQAVVGAAASWLAPVVDPAAANDARDAVQRGLSRVGVSPRLAQAAADKAASVVLESCAAQRAPKRRHDESDEDEDHAPLPRAHQRNRK